MSEEIILFTDDAEAKAAEAARLLQNDAFNDAYRSLIEDIERQLFMSDPSAVAAREQMYFLHRAAQLFVTNIHARITNFELRREED